MTMNNFWCSKKNGYITKGDWLLGCNVADAEPFTEAFRKMAQQYYLEKIVLCKDSVRIPSISMTDVLNKSLEKNKKFELYVPRDIYHICWDKQEELKNCSCNGALKCGGYCGECQLDLQASSSLWALKNEMVAGAAQMFTTYHEKYIARIRSHVYWKKSKLE